MIDLKRYEFSEMHKKLNKAHLEIVKRRQYRGARETDVVAWLADYVEQNFVPKAQLERAEKVIQHYVDLFGDRYGGKEAREYFKEK